MTDKKFKKLNETCLSDLIEKATNNYVEYWKSKTGQKNVDNPDYTIETDLKPGDFYIFALCEEYNNNKSDRSALSLASIVNCQNFRMKQIFERIKEEFHEELKYKVLAYSL